MKGEDVATTDSTPSPVSIRWPSRAMTASSARSMRAISRLPCVSVSIPRDRDSRQSANAITSIRGRAWLGSGPAWAATSSSDRPEPMAFSNALAWLFRAVNRKALSMMMVHDHNDAAASPTITALTTQSAVMNSSTGFSIEASAGTVMQFGP